MPDTAATEGGAENDATRDMRLSNSKARLRPLQKSPPAPEEQGWPRSSHTQTKAPLWEAARRSTGVLHRLVLQTLAKTPANDQAHGWIP